MPKKMLHTKWREKMKRKTQNQTDQIRKDIKVRGENWEEIQASGRIQMARDFSVIVDTYLWK
jgi:hypothetical protein